MARRAAVYSSARRGGTPAPKAAKPAPRPPEAAPPPPPPPQDRHRKRHIAISTVIAGGVAALIWFLVPTSAVPTDAFEEPAPAKLSAAQAYEMILPSVVHVRGYAEGEEESAE